MQLPIHRTAARSLMVLALALGATLVGGEARAQDDFFSSSPGALAASHASMDNRDGCNDCHSGGRETTNDKCLACHDHKDLRARINSGKGFHASNKVRGKKCDSCHLDHKGRGYDLMGWRAIEGGMTKFDHKLTGWELNGKHAAIDCDACHKTKNKQGLRTFLGEDKLCGSCHKRDQPHGFDRKEMMACERCHGESTWKPPKRRLDFDHNNKNDAGMTIVGSHEDVSCAKCHPKAKFNLKNKDPDFCGNCHDNPHDKHLFGNKDCEWCHSPKYRSLEKFKFNHAAKTRFDLGGGAHGKLQCYKCHTKSLAERKPDRSCNNCHAEDNKHKTRFKEFGDPPRCETCHPSSSWKPEIFNHTKRTKFNLTGKHAKTDCRSCHRGKSPSEFERFDAKKVGCMGCHKHKKVHDGEFKDKDCLRCHKDAGEIELTAKSVDIYHGPKSRFPLVRKHKDVKCAQCHVNDVYKETPVECGARCHEDSLHRGSLSEKCSTCHSGGTWEALTFDHTDDTKWPLNGLHAKINKCEDCHPTRQYTGTPTNCGAPGCHAKDDVHEGALGQTCEDCHLETGDNIFDHNSQSAYPLTGQHLTVRCSDCHPDLMFKPLPTNCYGCHPEPEVHKAQYGTICETCHTTMSFIDIKPLHDVGEFALKGSHDNQPCFRCHKDNRPLSGTGNTCTNCHRQDDIHANSLSPRCGECHTQWSFAPARFDHTTVGCNLSGLHRVLPCYDCHKSGNFGGLSPQCVGCHRDSALAVTSPDHTGFTVCSQCHNPNAWAPAGAGIAGYGRESICR